MTEKKWEINALGALSLEELKNLIGYKEADVKAFSGQPLARVYVVENPVQGDYLVGILEQEEIPALYQSYRDSAYDGIFIPSRGYGAIITLEKDAHKARTVIESILRTIELEAEERGEEAEKEDDAW